MRIAVTTWSNRRVGGVETYLSHVIPALCKEGHDLSLFYESDTPARGEPIVADRETPAVSVERLGRARLMEELAAWRPDVIFAHGAQHPEFDHEAGRVAPTVFFVHNYHGTCLGGMKTFTRPVTRPCDRVFGWRCFLHYYPRGCGGNNPVTMVKRYFDQSRRLKAVLACEAVVTHSHHMYCEFAKHGVPLSRLHRFPYYAAGELQQQNENAERVAAGSFSLPIYPTTTMTAEATSLVGPSGPLKESREPWRMMFVGRMDKLKGGGVLIESLPRVFERLNVPLDVTFAGEGLDRPRLEALAARVSRAAPGVRFNFTGWLSKEALDAALRECHLVVVPSLWPEPFGLVGPEAGWRGIPVAAFAVGGIRYWLIDGVNGSLAPADPPTSEGLAEAIVNCLRDPERYRQLRRGAVEMAQRFNRRDHLREFVNVFESVRRSR